MTTAVRIHAPGGPEALQVDEVPAPAPGPGQLLVETAAIGVNFIDTYHRSGLYPLELPVTLGVEAAGVVAAVGDDVSSFSVGDRVAWAMQPGSYATEVAVNAAGVIRVPAGVDFKLAAAVPLQGMTAHYLARSIVPLGEGDTAVVHAGAGGVGLLLTQVLRHLGIRVFTTVSTPDKAELSRAAGAEQVFGYDDFVAGVRDATGGAGARIVFDGIGASTFDASLDALGIRGTMVLFGAASGPVPSIDPQILNTKGSLLLGRPSLAHFIADPAELAWRAEEVFTAIADGSLDVRIGAEFALTDAADAHRALEGRQTTGKVLLIP
ncbi:MAG TPA: quinone oxidoreductase [Aeromicrobium sp.]|nr:quinone oxidoreductase [Aeromicrobium sp.]HKY58450.1 quinone oxidoreductase [Aeromicrobium sp.]